jgi:hypothetical protein
MQYKNRSLYKHLEGARVKLVHCNDQHTRIEPGTMGTVQFIDDVGTVHVRWDSGHGLGLCADDGDEFEIVSYKAGDA